MWVKRDDWVAREKSLAVQEMEIKLNRERILSLAREVDYWRGKYEEALNRADRVTDRLTSQEGRPLPVTDLGVRELDETQKKFEKMMMEAKREAIEMFSEETETPNFPRGGEEDEGLASEDLLEAMKRAVEYGE